MQQERPRYVINRLAYSLPDFDGEFDKKKRAFPIGEKVKKCFRYSVYILLTIKSPQLFISFHESIKLI